MCKPFKGYQIFRVVDGFKLVESWAPPATLGVQRNRLLNKAIDAQQYGHGAITRWDGPDVLHLIHERWMTSFYVA